MTELILTYTRGEAIVAVVSMPGSLVSEPNETPALYGQGWTTDDQAMFHAHLVDLQTELTALSRHVAEEAHITQPVQAELPVHRPGNIFGVAVHYIN